MKKLMGLCVLGLALCGCESFTFDSNLSPKRFVDYYKPSTVDEVSEAELTKLRHKDLGTVEGLSCQVKEDDYIATEADARTDARVKAAAKGANAIRFGKCTRLEATPACKVSVTCYAEAFIVDEQQEQQ
ncbi:MAG: exopolysaccharide synthesis regulator RcsF [Succinivibrio sp.]|nr:exopolysaccharide synthesis regulator RcsF [Succinivibrio sp.]